MSAPAVEVIQRQPYDPPTTRPSSPRVRVFLLTLLVALLIGQTANFLRPPVYQTAATLLTVKPHDVDQRSGDADLEHVAIQRRLLLGEEVLGIVESDLRAEGRAQNLPQGGLRSRLSVQAVPDTNLVELRAEGDDPRLLQRAVNHWADAYVQMRAARVSEASGRTTAALADEQTRLQAKLGEKRAELSTFREQHDILSMEREENQVLSRLKGLQASLNKAEERLVDARAQRSAIEAAIAAAQPVVPEYQKANLNALQAEARAIRERLAALEEQYTSAYLERDPTLKTLPGQLRSLEQRIRQILEVGRRQVLADADQELAAAAEAVRELRDTLTAQKSQVADFTRRFAEHQALVEELASLELLANQNQERLARIEISNHNEYPPLQIVDRAPLPVEPVRPLYWRDAGVITGVAVLLALFVTWLVDYLAGRARRDEPGFTGVRIYGGPTAPALENGGPQVQALPGNGQPRLVQQRPRALELGEVQALLQAASMDAARAITLLLSGVAPGELGSVRCERDADDGSLRVTHGNGQPVLLGPRAMRLFETEPPPDADTFSDDGSRAAIAIAAVDAGLGEPSSVTPEALHHTYLLYLVRQGVRLGDLGERVSGISAEQLAAYAPYSPPGPKHPWDAIEPVYPVFRSA
jgi:uncharacterized protein involved in exopolysaccharide biosynthesis